MKKRFLLTLTLISAMTATAFASTTKVAVNGNVVEHSNVIEENGTTYISVRPVAEALGLDVEWIANTKTVVISNKGPLYITFNIGENGYTFAKTAPMPLSAEPIIFDSAAYIPEDVITKLLSYEVNTEGSTLNIITDKASEQEEVVSGSGVVVEVSDKEILFNDDVKGEVRLNKSDNVVVTDSEGNKVDINSIKVDTKLTVEYGKAMTMSIPPLNNPVSITVLN